MLLIFNSCNPQSNPELGVITGSHSIGVTQLMVGLELDTSCLMLGPVFLPCYGSPFSFSSLFEVGTLFSSSQKQK